MQRSELTFDVVDDLVAAHVRGKLQSPSDGIAFVPSSVAPLIELAFSTAHGQPTSLIASPWLEPLTQADLRAALRNSQILWLDAGGHRGLMRTVFDPLKFDDDVPRTRFLMAARRQGLQLQVRAFHQSEASLNHSLTISCAPSAETVSRHMT